jgi:DNA polymerase
MAWVAGEHWKIEAFKAFDRKEGPDLYKLSYGRALNVDPETIEDDSWERQLGKVMELALQYYGGVGAFCSMAETYGLRLEVLAQAAWPVIPANFRRDAQAAWHKAVKRKRTYGLDERIWCVCHALVLTWRAAHPAICTFWAQLDQATKMATKVPNKEYKVGQFISVDRIGNWLRIKLPSGRYLSYPAPRGDDYTSSFMGVDPYTKQWKRISTYSGKRAENIVQAGAADILMDGLVAADEAGYNPVLSVHDEAITEPLDDDGYTDTGLSKLLVEASLWADGLPLAAKGFTACRYRK